MSRLTLKGVIVRNYNITRKQSFKDQFFCLTIHIFCYVIELGLTARALYKIPDNYVRLFTDSTGILVKSS